MNDYPTLPRLLASPLTRALRSSPAVVLTGARQTGKSTLAQMTAAELGHRYLTLDDVDVLERARSAPDALLRSAGKLVLDEVQRSPDLLLAVKRAIDGDRTPGRFILTGSADLLLMKGVSETLAGRSVHLNLWPLTRRERLGLGRAGCWDDLFAQPDDAWPELLREQEASAEEDWEEAARRGGYPVPAYRRTAVEERSLWFAGYTQTYLERDLRDLAAVESLVDFRRLMGAACLRLGNLVNQTELGRDVGLSQPTVHRHLDLLEVSYQLARLPAYAVNRTKRLIKTPKLFWSDTGLALHLSRETAPRGAHFENLVVSDLLAWRGSIVDGPEILFWRTTGGDEVDLVVEWQNRLLPIEVKATRKPRLTDAKGLRSFRAEYPDVARAGLLLHAGTEIGWLADGVLACPWWRVV